MNVVSIVLANPRIQDIYPVGLSKINYDYLASKTMKIGIKNPFELFFRSFIMGQ